MPPEKEKKEEYCKNGYLFFPFTSFGSHNIVAGENWVFECGGTQEPEVIEALIHALYEELYGDRITISYSDFFRWFVEEMDHRKNARFMTC